MRGGDSEMKKNIGGQKPFRNKVLTQMGAALVPGELDLVADLVPETFNFGFVC